MTRSMRMMGLRKTLTGRIPAALLLCAALAAPASGAMSDKEFLDLCSNGSLPRVEIALENGANVNAEDENGVTALMRAARDNFHPVVLHALLNAGADVEAWDFDGRRASWYARKNKRLKDVFARTRLEVASGEYGALLKASYGGTAKEVQIALDMGAEVGTATHDGMTALMWAAYNNPRVEVIDVLVKAGADVNARNELGQTALMRAAYYNTNPRVIEALLDAGADPDMKDKNNIRAVEFLRWRRSMHDTEAMKRLDALDAAGRKPDVQPSSEKEARATDDKSPVFRAHSSVQLQIPRHGVGAADENPAPSPAAPRP